MAIVRLLPGESAQVDAWFRASDGRPLIPATGAVANYSVRDAAGNLITNGVGIQDSGNPARWYTQLVLPLSSPTNISGQKSSITWDLATSDGTSPTVIELFEIVAPVSEVTTGTSTDLVVMEGTPLADSLIVPTLGQAPIALVSYKVVDQSGMTLYGPPALTPTTIGPASTTYQIIQTIPGLNVGTNGDSSYLGIWTVIRTGLSNTYEVHPIYAANAPLLMVMNDLRMLIDRAKLGDIHPYLNWSTADLLHFIYKGIEYVAAFPPIIMQIDPSNIPKALVDFVVKAAAISALRAQFLAEGMSAFDFQGLGVQLNVDRTQYLQAMIDELQNDLDNHLSAVKAALAHRGPGALAISVGTFTNFPYTGFVYDLNGSSSRRWWSQIPY